MDILLPGSEYQNTGNHFTLHSFPSPHLFHIEAPLHLLGESRPWAKAGFFSTESKIPWNLFHAASHWLTHLFYLPSAIHYLHCQQKEILLLLNSFFFWIYEKAHAPHEDAALRPNPTPTCSCWEGLCRWRCFCRAVINIHQFLVGSISPPSLNDTHTHNSATQKTETLLKQLNAKYIRFALFKECTLGKVEHPWYHVVIHFKIMLWL